MHHSKYIGKIPLLLPRGSALSSCTALKLPEAILVMKSYLNPAAVSSCNALTAFEGNVRQCQDDSFLFKLDREWLYVVKKCCLVEWLSPLPTA